MGGARARLDGQIEGMFTGLVVESPDPLSRVNVEELLDEVVPLVVLVANTISQLTVKADQL